ARAEGARGAEGSARRRGARRLARRARKHEGGAACGRGPAPREGRANRGSMRIALTHNLRLTDSEEEAEFDSRETIDALTAAMERLGHRVERIEVSGPASRTAARIEAFSPELIFNTAEGRRGRFREAFYPALFDELGFPYTGSDAWVLAVTLDKALTKLMLSEHGVISPRGQFIDDLADLKLEGWRFPLIVKPNFEGSSKGITQDSVCEERGRL